MLRFNVLRLQTIDLFVQVRNLSFDLDTLAFYAFLCPFLRKPVFDPLFVIPELADGQTLLLDDKVLGSDVVLTHLVNLLSSDC